MGNHHVMKVKRNAGKNEQELQNNQKAKQKTAAIRP